MKIRACIYISDLMSLEVGGARAAIISLPVMNILFPFRQVHWIAVDCIHQTRAPAVANFSRLFKCIVLETTDLQIEPNTWRLFQYDRPRLETEMEQATRPNKATGGIGRWRKQLSPHRDPELYSNVYFSKPRPHRLCQTHDTSSYMIDRGCTHKWCIF